MPLKCSFEAQFSRMYMFFGTRNPNLRSILKPEVELMFLRMRRKNARKTAENAIKIQFEGVISRAYMFLARGIRIWGPF